MTKDNEPNSNGWFPPQGIITGEEVRRRLKAKDLDNLQESLAKAGVKHRKLAGKRIYQCEDLEQLFYEEE